jgi:hypothetical protein
MIQYFKYRQGKQRSFLVWENVVLVRAANSEEAYAKAEKMGREEEAMDDPSLRIGNHPAKMVFAGVRKVVECLDCDRRPGDGTEVSYTEMELRSEAAIRRLVAGDAVAVTIADTFDEEPEESKVKPRRAM